jgi:hypothetical protein
MKRRCGGPIFKIAVLSRGVGRTRTTYPPHLRSTYVKEPTAGPSDVLMRLRRKQLLLTRSPADKLQKSASGLTAAMLSLRPRRCCPHALTAPSLVHGSIVDRHVHIGVSHD